MLFSLFKRPFVYDPAADEIYDNARRDNADAGSHKRSA
jgi:hypothetical protein